MVPMPRTGRQNMTEQSPAGREPRDANSIDYSTLSDQDVERADCLVPSPVAMSTLIRLLIDLAGPALASRLACQQRCRDWCARTGPHTPDERQGHDQAPPADKGRQNKCGDEW